MPRPDEPLRENEVGPFGELSKRPNPDGLVVLPVPPFEAMLPFIEQRAGRQLTPEEVEAERLRAPSIVLSQDAAQKVEAARAARGR